MVMARWFVTVDGAHVERVVRGAALTRRVGDEASLKGWSGDNTRFRTSTIERVHVQHFSRSACGAIKFSNAERGRMWDRLWVLSRRYCWISWSESWPCYEIIPFLVIRPTRVRRTVKLSNILSLFIENTWNIKDIWLQYSTDQFSIYFEIYLSRT